MKSSDKKPYLVQGYLTVAVRKRLFATSLSEAITMAQRLQPPSVARSADGKVSIFDSIDQPGLSHMWDVIGFEPPPDDSVQLVIEEHNPDQVYERTSFSGEAWRCL